MAIELINASFFDTPPRSKTVSLVLTDPPFGATQNSWDYEIDVDLFWWSLKPWLVDDATVVAFSDMRTAVRLIASREALPFRYDLIWRKNKPRGHLNAKRRPMRSHETILVFGAATYTPEMSIGHKPINYAKNHNGSGYGKGKPTISRVGATDRYPQSVIDWPVVNNDDPERIHPSQKPVDLCRYLTRMFNSTRGVVLDPFAGSGSSLIAAQLENCDSVGFELNSDIARKASSRIERYL